MTRSLPPREIVALAVLGLLLEGPSHTYNLNREIRARKMSFVTGLPRSVYHAIDRLAADGLIRLVETNRDGRRPERSVYEITEGGTTRFYDDLTNLLMTPSDDRVLFTIGLSFVVRMPPDTVADVLRTRAAHLRAELAEVETTLNLGRAHAHRLVLLEWEYTMKVRQAELEWVDRLGEEIASRRLDWDPEAILRDPSILAK